MKNKERDLESQNLNIDFQSFCVDGNIDGLISLLDKGEVDIASGIRVAASFGRQNVLELLINHSYDDNLAKSEALFTAAYSGKKDTVVFLLNKGANPAPAMESVFLNIKNCPDMAEPMISLLTDCGVRCYETGFVYAPDILGVSEHTSDE